MDTLSAILILLLVIDPLGNVPAFLAILSPLDPARRRRVFWREMLVALAIMLFFLLLGGQFMRLLGLADHTVRMAGGVILFLIALRMVYPSLGPMLDDAADHEPFIVPLAVPLIAGPSVLATLMLLHRQDPNRTADWLLALGAAWAVSAVVLAAGEHLRAILKERGLRALTRLMGMLLVMVSIQMFLDGVSAYRAAGP